MSAKSLRERKKDQTREALSAAALELFADQGFDSTTIDEIAEAANVSRRTFFRYFDTKEAVCFPARMAQLDRFVALLRDVDVHETPFAAVRRACIAVGHELVLDREASIMLNDLVISTPALIAYERTIDLSFEAAIAEGLIARTSKSKAMRRRANIIAGATFGVVRAVIREWFERRGKVDLIKLGNEALDLLESGVATQFNLQVAAPSKKP